EQSYVLDRDGCLVCESLDQRNLFVGERLDLRLDETDDAFRSSFPEHGDCENRPKGEHLLRLVECVFWVCLDVDDLHRAALEYRPAHRCSPASADGGALPQFQKFARQIMSGHCAARIAIVTENHSSVRATEPDGRSQERIKYHLQVERRATNHLEHIGGGGLLLKGLA